MVVLGTLLICILMHHTVLLQGVDISASANLNDDFPKHTSKHKYDGRHGNWAKIVQEGRRTVHRHIHQHKSSQKHSTSASLLRLVCLSPFFRHTQTLWGSLSDGVVCWQSDWCLCVLGLYGSIPASKLWRQLPVHPSSSSLCPPVWIVLCADNTRHNTWCTWSNRDGKCSQNLFK